MKNDQLAAVFGAERVLGCMANFSGEMFTDGTVAFTRNVCLFVGGAEPLASGIAQAMNRAGVVSAASAEIESVEWTKFVGWIALFFMSISARTTTGVFLNNPHLAGIVASLIREVAALAAARNIPLLEDSIMPVKGISTLPVADAIEKVREAGRDMHAKAPNHRMSSLQDLEAGRQLEVHETLGYVAREAERLGIDAPVTAQCYALAAGLNDLPR